MEVHWHAILEVFILLHRVKKLEFEIVLADFEGLGCSIYEANDEQSSKICWAQRLWFDNFR